MVILDSRIRIHNLVILIILIVSESDRVPPNGTLDIIHNSMVVFIVKCEHIGESGVNWLIFFQHGVVRIYLLS